jgi:ABC-type dipeptide/oligopeptide/nickel transport system ATPase component
VIAVGLQDVVKRFGSVTAVDGLSFSVRTGQCVSLLGPSGCGKTTTLRLIAGFEVPDMAIVRMGGQANDAHIGDGNQRPFPGIAVPEPRGPDSRGLAGRGRRRGRREAAPNGSDGPTLSTTLQGGAESSGSSLASAESPSG